jgi:hypothetical protein
MEWAQTHITIAIETHWSMSSVSQAARKNKQSAHLPKTKKKNDKSHHPRLSFLNLLFLLTTTVSSPWVAICGIQHGVEDKRVRRDIDSGLILSPKNSVTKIDLNPGQKITIDTLSHTNHPIRFSIQPLAGERGGVDSLCCSFFISIDTEEPNR